MKSNSIFQKFQKNHAKIIDFAQEIKSLSEFPPEIVAESLEELTVAMEELNVAQEELLQQNQEIEQVRTKIEIQSQRYQDLFELAPDGYLVTDKAGNIQQANRAASELFKVSQQFLAGKPLSIFVPPADRAFFRAKLNKVVEGLKVAEWEIRLKPRHGDIFVAAITVSSFRSEENNTSNWLWLIRDITERKQTEIALRKMHITETANRILFQELKIQQQLEIALRESESRFRYIFEEVGVSIWEENFTQVKAALQTLQAQGVEDLRQYLTEHPEFIQEAINLIQVLDVNSTTVQMFEAESKEQLLVSLPQICLPETVEIFIDELVAIAAGCTLFSGETVVQTLTGKPMNVLFTIKFPSVNDLSERVIVTLFDISDRKRAEQLLTQQAEDLQQLNVSLTQTSQLLIERNQELDRFVYIVSHDLKAPLRAISNLSTWLAEDLSQELSDNSLHQITLLQQRVQRMEDLIDGLLVYSRAGRNETESQMIDVAELVDEILDSLAPPATFNIIVANNLPRIFAKRLLLSQVFSNLISNAIKHHDRVDGHIHISSMEQPEYCVFSIADDGPGIAPEHYQRVFDIFQTLKASNNNENTGIGLSIVKKITEAEGGEIWLESELGKGTTFYFTWLKHSQ
ncbi:ATP-binding protein [Chroococcus sp. FPU101]|uniref:ATP-binding protein n=1 Tax=Chroococcus sp. FPU101 TaxID=1974212 RepID=UPI001A8E128D|nr:ATP-binding protein [Chroococcus sp. FPU101]GFE70588.1 multi-sensor signal transduction histidine kinase [Chroococcus sp. FPU101]